MGGGGGGSKPFLVPPGKWSPRLRVGSLSSQNSADPVRADARLKTRPSAGNRAGSVGPPQQLLRIFPRLHDAFREKATREHP